MIVFEACEGIFQALILINKDDLLGAFFWMHYD